MVWAMMELENSNRGRVIKTNLEQGNIAGNDALHGAIMA
jgi:hypothetical protein